MSGKASLSLFDHPQHLLEMAKRLIADNKGSAAASLAQQAMDYADDSGLLREIGKLVLTHKIPGFHGPMLHDVQRNSAYAAAITALAPDRTVLDIGTGSGLLAMVAAKAGASHVYACELDQRLAQTARDIIAANGLADRVTILPVHSTKLDRDRDLAGGADLVISEIFSDDLLGESVLSSLGDVQKRLCRPGAIFLPTKASIRIALAGQGPEGPAGETGPIAEVEGCDLSLFNRHIPRRRRFARGYCNPVLRSDPADLFTFDFQCKVESVGQRRLELPSFGGSVGGVVQWIWFEAAAGHRYENAPNCDAQAHWTLIYHPFERPLETIAGETVTVSAWHSDQNLLIWNAS